jgi:hypothetical protein
MDSLFGLSARPEIIVDNQGFRLADPRDGSLVGPVPLPPPLRLVHAVTTNTQSGLTRRYWPALAPGEIAVFGIDFSNVIPFGIGIASGTLFIVQNIVGATGPAIDVTAGAVSVQDRALYATVSADAGASGTDYVLTWTATATDGKVYPRTALVLCAPTS